MSGVVSGFTVIFLVVALGCVLGRTGSLGEHASSVLARLVFFVCTPALLIHSLATSDLSVVFSSTLAIASASALIVGATYALIARLWLHRAIPEVVIGALSSSYVNSVNLGLPIAIFVLDDASFIAPLLLFQIVFYSPIALTALDLLTGDEGSCLRDKLRRNIEQVATAIVPLQATLSPILPLIIGSSEDALDLSSRLYRDGLLIPAIRYPTVPRDQPESISPSVVKQWKSSSIVSAPVTRPT